METAEHQCLYCNKPLKGRTDKKFCDDFCRNSYNNEKNSDANNLVRNINNILRKNRRLLKAHIPDDTETVKVKRDTLLREGYQFKYQTHELENRKGQTYFFCYEYGYLPLENDWILIVHSKTQQQ